MAAAAIPRGTFLALIVSFILLLRRPAMAQTCGGAGETFDNNRVFSTCLALPILDAAIHYTYDPSAATVDVAYRALQSSGGWIAWALNPTGFGMIGAQALIAFKGGPGGGMVVYPTGISSLSPAVAADGNLSFPVMKKSATFVDGVMTIYATVGLPANRTKINQVWQAGSTFSGGVPAGHVTTGDHVASMGTIDFLSGQAAAGGITSIQRRKNIHGVLNAISWGILMPIGVIMARYVKVFADPAWFYLHIACQLSAYILGVAGWGTGLKLGSDSPGITYHSHRSIGITLFCLATLQVFALLMRPKPTHKYRIYWNVYHRGIGYLVIILSLVNIFKGFGILDPAKGWKHAYIGIIVVIACVAAVLECVTWAVVLKRKAAEEKPHQGYGGGRQDYGP